MRLATMPNALVRNGALGKRRDNGAVIVIVPKTKDVTEKFSLQQAMDSKALYLMRLKRIVEHEFIPILKNDTIEGNRYAIGINRSVDVMIQLASQEYSADEYYNSTIEKDSNLTAYIIFAIILIIMAILKPAGSSSSGGYSGGGGGYSRGGGFSGGGGGSFGGGGAGGRW